MDRVKALVGTLGQHGHGTLLFAAAGRCNGCVWCHYGAGVEGGHWTLHLPRTIFFVL